MKYVLKECSEANVSFHNLFNQPPVVYYVSQGPKKWCKALKERKKERKQRHKTKHCVIYVWIKNLETVTELYGSKD